MNISASYRLGKHRFLTYPLLLLSLFFLLSCGTSHAPVATHPTTRGTLWVQNAAEYQAITTQIYNNALSYLETALSDSLWTASLEQQKGFCDLPPAIILDVDETVLDNSVFQARMIKQNRDYDPEQWNQWAGEAKADAVAGALTFVQAAYEMNISIYYITNREAKVEEATRRNLLDLGFPLPPGKDVILTKGERKNWTSDKISRRKKLAGSHRIMMLIGDDLNDFLPAKSINRQERMELVQNHKTKWGRQWHILPNPIYGSWEQALYNFDNSMSPKEKESIQEQLLNTKEEG